MIEIDMKDLHEEMEMKWIASNASLLNLVLQSRWIQVGFFPFLGLFEFY